MRFGQTESKAEQDRKKKRKAREVDIQRRKQKDTSKTHPGENTGQFCICLEKDVFGTQFGEFALSNL